MLLCRANVHTISVSDKSLIYDESDFPVTSEIKARFKKDEGGSAKMDATLQKWMQECEEIGEKRGREEGLLLGKEEGLMLGKEQGAKIIAKTMLDEGLPTELIMRYTGLSEDVIATLQS